MSIADRQPAGTPSGGQFAPGGRPRAGVNLYDTNRVAAQLSDDAGPPLTQDEVEQFTRRLQRACGRDQAVHEAIQTLRWAARHYLGDGE